MNIGIDARLFSDKITGINRYLRNVLKYLPQFDRQNKYFVYLYEGVSFDDPFYNITKIKRSRLPRQVYEHYWLNLILPGILEEQKIDIFFTPYILVPLNKRKHKNVIVIHDSVTESYKNSHRLHYRKYMSVIVPGAVKRSDKVITVSQSARRDIIKNFKVPEEKIDYMHLWTDEKYHPRVLSEDEKQQLRIKYNLPEKFILYVGVIEDRKNIQGIIKISDILVSKGVDIKFVLIGKEGYGFGNHIAEIEKRKDRFIYHQWMEENTLPKIYNLASCFIFPSYYEGFGLPPLEAMKSGLPVLSSDNTSLPEVVGDGGLMRNARDYEGFADDIIRLLNNNQFYEQMKGKALKQAEKFTPEKQMPRLIEIFNSLTAS